MRDLVEVAIETNGAPAMLAAVRPAGARSGGRSVTVNRAESPLSWLRARALIDARAYEAGERLRADYERAALAPGVTMRWDAARAKSTGGSDPTTMQIDARRRFDRALDERRTRPVRHLVARGVRGRAAAGGRTRARLADPQRAAGADSRARPAGRPAAGGWC